MQNHSSRTSKPSHKHWRLQPIPWCLAQPQQSKLYKLTRQFWTTLPHSHHENKRLLKPFSIYQASMFKRFGASQGPTFMRPASIANSPSWWVPWSKGFPWMGNWFWQRLDRIGFCQTYGMPKYSQRWENIHARPHQKWGLDIMFPK